MFKFSAVSQIWKKYIQKLNDWDLPLTYFAEYIYSIDYYSFGMKVSAHGDTGTVPSAGDAKRDARPNCSPNFRHILGFFTFKLPITSIIGFI